MTYLVISWLFQHYRFHKTFKLSLSGQIHMCDDICFSEKTEKLWLVTLSPTLIKNYRPSFLYFPLEMLNVNLVYHEINSIPLFKDSHLFLTLFYGQLCFSLPQPCQRRVTIFSLSINSLSS